MEFILVAFIIFCIIVLFGVIGGAKDNISCEKNQSHDESDKDRISTVEKVKWTPKEIIEDSDKQWHLIVDDKNQCLVYRNKLECNDFVLKLSDIQAISFSRNFELVFSTYPVYKDKLDDIHKIIPEWLNGGRYLKKSIKNLSLNISYSNESGDSCHIIDLFDIEKFDDRKRGVRDIDDYLAPYLMEAYHKGLRVYEIFLKEMERREKVKWLQDPELPKDENPIERIKANTEFFRN